MLAAAELVPIAERIVACRDPTDDKFLELAVNGKHAVSTAGASYFGGLTCGGAFPAAL